jgi:trimeric autotransporter adhesin
MLNIVKKMIFKKIDTVSPSLCFKKPPCSIQNITFKRIHTMNIFRMLIIGLLSMMLMACGSDSKDDTSVTISPATATVKVGKTISFTSTVTGNSNTSVNWRVDQTNGGSITSSGVYTAPNTPGVYSISAISQANNDRIAKVAITVVPLDKAMVRVFHASPDAPKVNLWVNDAVAASNLDYEKSTGQIALNEGIYKVAVEGIIPSGNATVIGPVNLTLAGNTDYDVIAVNKVANIEPLIISDTGNLTDNSKVRVRVAHLTAAAPAVKVFVTAPGADLTGVAPLGTFSFKETIGPVEVAAGNYQIRVALADNTLVFDSGTVSLAAGKDLLIGAIPNVHTGSSPISLAVLDGSAVAVIHDKSAGANLRVVHASANAPAVDVLANNGTTPAVTNLAFPDATGYLNLPAATYNFKVVPTGTLTPAVINADVPLANGSSYTLLAVNQLSAIEPLLATDNLRKVATEARIRLLHASTLAANVDIYVVAAGTFIANATPNFANVPFKADTGYVSLAAGSYDVIITPTGTKTEAIKVTLALSNGKIYTAIARDGTNLTTPLGVIGLDELAAN